MKKIDWSNLHTLTSQPFNCGYCGHSVASDKGYVGKRSDGQYVRQLHIYICHQCHKPTFIDEYGNQTPQKTFGRSVPNINDTNIETLYEEARSCYSANAFTSSTMACRKLLMNIAVSKGAEENKKFQYYVDYLEKNNFIPNGTKDWVDAIRTKGNEATHEIALSSKEEAEEILGFAEMLLRLTYEFPSKALKYKIKKPEEAKVVDTSSEVKE